jgi:prepilin-type processing-associated H-X9-DG protein
MYEEDGSPLFSYKTQKSASYGMNWFLNEKEAKRANAAQARLACLSKPEQIVLFADSKGPYLLPERFWQHEMDLRHQEQANFAFADGHVELLKQEHFGSYDDKGQFRSDFSKWHWQ